MGHRGGYQRIPFQCPECRGLGFRIEARIGGALLIYCVREFCEYYVGHIDTRAGIYVGEVPNKAQNREERVYKRFPFD